MSIRKLFSSNRSSDAGQSSLRPPTYTSSAAAPPYGNAHNLTDQVSTWSASTPDTANAVDSDATTPTGPRYIYYHVYAEDGAIPSMKSTTADDPFLGRIKSTSVAPPHTVETLKYCIVRSENITDLASTRLFLTSSSQSPMDDTGKVTILGRSGPGYTPEEPLALVGKLSDSDRSNLKSRASGEFRSITEDGATSPPPRYLYYQLFRRDGETPSKACVDPEEPSLGRIRADAVAPPYTPTSIKRCISRVEGNPALTSAHLYADRSCDTPIKEGHMPILVGNCPGLSQNQPMALVGAAKPAAEAPRPEETPVAEPTKEEDMKPTVKAAKVGRRLSARVGEFFKPRPTTETVTPAKVDENPPKIDEPAPVAPLENPAMESKEAAPAAEAAASPAPAVAVASA